MEGKVKGRMRDSGSWGLRRGCCTSPLYSFFTFFLLSLCDSYFFHPRKSGGGGGSLLFKFKVAGCR